MKVSELKKIASEYKHIHRLPVSKMNKAQLEELVSEIEKWKKGSGLFKDAFRLVKKGVEKVSSTIKDILFFSPNKLPPSAKKVYDKFSKSEIADIQIRREPLQSVIKTFLNLVSFGALEKKLKELNYDDIFHLSMLVIFRNGSKISVEKNQRISIKEGYTGNMGKQQAVDVSRELLEKNRLTLEGLLGNAQKSMGDFKFFQYNARENNCQHFILGILDANGLNNSNLREFIKQDAEEIFKSMPDFMKNFSQGITDTAGKVQQIFEGGKKNVSKKKKNARSIYKKK